MATKRKGIPNTVLIYGTLALMGGQFGWGFAVPLREMADAAPSDNPALWILAFGIGTPLSVWLHWR